MNRSAFTNRIEFRIVVFTLILLIMRPVEYLNGQSALTIENISPLWSTDIEFHGYGNPHLIPSYNDYRDLLRFDDRGDIYILYNIFGSKLIEGYALYKLNHENGAIEWEYIRQSKDKNRTAAHSPRVTSDGYEILINYEINRDSSQLYWGGLTKIGKAVHRFADGSVVDSVVPRPGDTLAELVSSPLTVTLTSVMVDYIPYEEGYIYFVGYSPRASEFMTEVSHLNKEGHLLYKKSTTISLPTPKINFKGGITENGDMWVFLYNILKGNANGADTVYLRMYLYDTFLNLRSVYDFSDIADISSDVKSFDIAWDAEEQHYYLMSYSNAEGGPHKRVVIRKFDLDHTLRARMDLFGLPYEIYSVGLVELSGDTTLLHFTNADQKGKEVNFYIARSSGEIEHLRTLRLDTNFVSYLRKATVTPSGHLLAHFEYKTLEEYPSAFIPWHNSYFLFDIEDFVTSISPVRNHSIWTLWPNPTTGRVYLKGEGFRPEVRIFSLDGREKEVYCENGVMNISDYEPGTYIVQIYSRGRLVAVKRIVKL